MMFLLTPSLLTTFLLSAVLTVVFGSEYYSRLPTAEDKHLYEYGSDTDDIINPNVDDQIFTLELTQRIVFFDRSYTSFRVSNPHTHSCCLSYSEFECVCTSDWTVFYINF